MADRICHYRCLGCGHQFMAFPGPVAQAIPESKPDAPWHYVPATMDAKPLHPGCRSCGHVYIKWLNYEQDFAAGRCRQPETVLKMTHL